MLKRYNVIQSSNRKRKKNTPSMAVLFVSVLLHTFVLTVLAALCKKEFFYHQHYGYGYDIYCSDLDNETMSELIHTVVYNEIELTIEHSNFSNTNWHIAKHLPKLRQINMLYCHLDDLYIFNGLNKLNLINIQHSRLDKVKYNFLKDLENLQEIILTNNSLDNTIFDDFKSMDSVLVLNLNRNLLSGILDANNCEFYNLNQIYMQHNRIEEIGNISCLNFVEEMYLDYNNVIKINNLHDLVDLKVLSLKHNYIDSLASLQNLKHLEILVLEGNQISVLEDAALYNMNSLKHLNLKDNQIYVIADTFFTNILNLKYLNLRNNSIENVSLKYLSKIEEINLSYNKISSLKFLSNKTALNKLDLSYNDIREIGQYIFSRLSPLTTLNLSYNFIENNIYDASFFGLMSLKDLQMVNTSTSYIPESAFMFSPSLEILNLSRNKMRVFGKLFEKLTNLQILNISYNNLEELHFDTIKNSVNLQTIDVESNDLKSIEYESIVTNLHMLMTINIKNNTLSCDFLSKIIKFFNGNRVNYTINEDFQYDKENVAGIYCKENKDKKNASTKQTSLVLEGNRVLLRQLYNLTKNSTEEYNKTLTHSVIYATIAVVLVTLVLTFMSYKIYSYLKRRHYCSDEFELIGKY